MTQFVTYLLVGLYAATTVGIILVVIADNRNPLKTMPWILILIFAPIAGIVLYFFFGQNLSKQKIITYRTRRRLTTYPQEAYAEGAIPDNYLPLARLLERTVNAAPFRGNRITPYTDGASKLEALLRAIEGAQHHIHLQYYILSDDATGRRLRDALVLKARAGVEVRILYDDVGCGGVKRAFFDSMRAEGIEAHAFLHVRFPLLTSRVNYRNHNKIAVIDGRVGFFGGMNIADRYV